MIVAPIKAESASSIDFTDTAIAFAHLSNTDMQRTFWLFKMMNNPTMVRYGSALMSASLKLHLPIKWAIKATVFRQFCGGEDIKRCQQTIDALGKSHIGAILDYSVEGEKTEKAFNTTAEEIIDTIRTAASHKHIPFSVFKVTGIAAFSLLEKIQAKSTLSDQERTDWEKAQERVNRICAAAADMQVRIFFDGEETWIQDTIDNLCYTNMERYNKLMPIVYNTYQMYRHESLANMKAAIAKAHSQGYFFGAKIVRGAYMEKERKRAADLGYTDPIQPNKDATDKDYNAAMLFSLDHIEHVSICAGTHNENSSKLLALEMEKRGIAHDDERIYFSQLLGMSDNISYVLAARGYNVAKYVPYGPVASVMPYLLRRANENTSIAGQSSREFLLVDREMKRRKGA
jgi:proline dehydrogenase